jgi:hypothetical protein
MCKVTPIDGIYFGKQTAKSGFQSIFTALLSQIHNY